MGRRLDRNRTGAGRLVAAALVVALSATAASAGIAVVGSSGIAATGADGVHFERTSGIAATGVDGALAFRPNGITATGVDGIAATGADGAAFAGTNGIAVTGADSLSMARADGITATGADGVTIRLPDGSTYVADAVVLHEPTGITATGVDGITATGVDGLLRPAADAVSLAGADGIAATGADGLAFVGAAGITATGVDGALREIAPDGATLAGVTGISATGADGIAATGVDALETWSLDGITATGVDGRPGLQSVDPQLALELERLADDSNVNAVVVYHAATTDADVADLRRLGLVGGTRYRRLPMIAVTATRRQLFEISRLPAVRSIYGVRTLASDAASPQEATGLTRVEADPDLAWVGGGAGPTGRGVTIAVLDTGVDSRHPDLAGRVVRNLRLADVQSVRVGFGPPPEPASLANTDLLHGHGTFVAGVAAGSGAASGGRYRGVAPGASILGLSAGDLALLSVLAGFDYLLERGAADNVRVVNCSFSANTVFDVHDPVNVATRMLADRGVTVVVSAGNTGPGWATLNPYAAAPWVVGVGATDDALRLADFSSRGDLGAPALRPKLVAPGLHVVGPRPVTGPSVTGVLGLESAVTTRGLAPAELAYYTTASGTSFSAPQVAGVVALMLEANPSLSVADVLDVLQRTATPLAPLLAHEAGAGALNAHAAVLEAAFPERRFGALRAGAAASGVEFVLDPARELRATAAPGQPWEADVVVPEHAIAASVRVAWGPLLTTNDLALAVLDAGGRVAGSSNAINLPGLTGRRERVALADPAPGAYRVRVSHTVGLVATPQPFDGAVEIARVVYPELADLGSLDAAARADALFAMRTFALAALGRRFHAGAVASRADLARAALAAGRVPQYLAAERLYADVARRDLRVAVESAQRAPGGPLFYDAPEGASFRHSEAALRLVAAVALVRAAGLDEEARMRAGEPLALADAASVPGEYAGYVAVALERGLLAAPDARFRPDEGLTRGELASAVRALVGLLTRE